MSVTFVRDKETKNTYRYVSEAASGSPAEVSGSIYVRKDSELAKDAEIVIEICEKVAEPA